MAMKNTPLDATPLVSTLAGDAGMANLVEQYVAGLPAKAAEISRLLADQALADLALLAHRLKGSAGGYGFPDITEAARDVEREARTAASLDRLRAEVARLTQLCSRARAG